MDRLLSLVVLIAQFASIAIAVDPIDLTTPVRVINVSQASQVGHSIGVIGSEHSHEAMKAPFYIVPVIPEDADLFRRDIAVDLDSGRIFLNATLDNQSTSFRPSRSTRARPK